MSRLTAARRFSPEQVAMRLRYGWTCLRADGLSAPKLSDTVFLFNNVFPEGNDRRHSHLPTLSVI